MSYFDKFNTGAGIPFMDGRDAGKIVDLVGQAVHVSEFAFLKNDEGEYAVFIVAEDDKAFYFANSIVTDVLRQIEKDGMAPELPKQTVKIVKKTSKKGRDYTAIEFVDEEIPF